MKVPDKQDIILEVTAKTNTGMQREANEDNFVVTPDSKSPEWILPKGEYPNTDGGTVLVVADGMGGMNAGEVASKIAVNSIRDYFIASNSAKELKQVLSDAIINANSDIVKHGKDFPETSGMGSTIVMAMIKGASLHLSWVGDSRCYLWRNGQLMQISKDHSYVQSLVDEGKLTKEQAFIHPESNIILQSLGDELRKPKPGYLDLPLADNDIVLLCSDGLNSMLRDEEIANIIKENSGLAQIAEKLIEGANNAGGHDNITVVMGRVVSGAGQSNAVIGDNKTIDDIYQPKKKSNAKLWYTLIAILVIAVIGVYAMKHFQKPVTDDNKTKKDSTSTTRGKDTTEKQKNISAPVEHAAGHSKKDTGGKQKINTPVPEEHGHSKKDSIDKAMKAKAANKASEGDKKGNHPPADILKGLTPVKTKKDTTNDDNDHTPER